MRENHPFRHGVILTYTCVFHIGTIRSTEKDILQYNISLYHTLNTDALICTNFISPMSTEMTGIIAGIFTGISLLPQLVKLVRERKPQDISALMLTALLIGLSLWVVYGIQKQDWPIIVTNSFSLLVNCCLIVLNFYYRKRKH